MGLIFGQEKTAPIVSTLNQAKEQALKKIDTQASKAYVSGFTSSASGTAMIYDSDAYTQTEIQTTAVTAASSTAQFDAQFSSGFPIRAKENQTSVKQELYLTAAQTIQLASDWILRYKEIKAQVWTLQEKINEAATIADIEKITISIT